MEPRDASSLTLDQILVASVLGSVVLATVFLNLVLVLLLWSNGRKVQGRSPKSGAQSGLIGNPGEIGKPGRSENDAHDVVNLQRGRMSQAPGTERCRYPAAGLFSTGDDGACDTFDRPVISREGFTIYGSSTDQTIITSGAQSLGPVTTNSQYYPRLLARNRGQVERGVPHSHDTDFALAPDVCDLDSASHSENVSLTPGRKDDTRSVNESSDQHRHSLNCYTAGGRTNTQSKDSVSPKKHAQSVSAEDIGGQDQNIGARESSGKTEQEEELADVEAGKRKYRTHKQSRILWNSRRKENRLSHISSDFIQATDHLDKNITHNTTEKILPGLQVPALTEKNASWTISTKVNSTRSYEGKSHSKHLTWY